MSERKIGALLSPLLEETTLSDNEHLLLSKRLPRPVGSVQHIGRCKLVSAAGTWWQNFPTDPSPHLCLCLYLYLCLTASALVLAFPLLSPVHRRTNSRQRTSLSASQPASRPPPWYIDYGCRGAESYCRGPAAWIAAFLSRSLSPCSLAVTPALRNCPNCPPPMAYRTPLLGHPHLPFSTTFFSTRSCTSPLPHRGG